MKINASEPKLWAPSDVPAGSVVALYNLDDAGVPSLRGKGAPRVWDGTGIVRTENMAPTLRTEHYLGTSGHLFVIGTAVTTDEGTKTPSTNAAVVNASGRSAAVKTTKVAKSVPSSSDDSAVKVLASVAAMLADVAKTVGTAVERLSK